MTDINRVSGGPKKRPSIEQVAEQSRASVFESAGLKGDLDPSKLGPRGQKVAEELLQAFKSTGGTATHDDIKAGAQKLKAALREDWVGTLNLGDPPRGNDALIAKNPERSFVERDGKIELAGPMASPTHGVARLLAAVGIQPQALTPELRDRLLNIISDPKISLSNPADFKKAAMALGDVTGASGVVPKGLERQFSNSTPIEMGTTTRIGEASAPKTSGVGTSANALNALIANRVAGKEKPGDAEKAKLVDDLAKSMGVENLTPEQKQKLAATLDKILTDPSNPGAPDPTRIMANAFIDLSRSTQDPEPMRLAAALTHQLEAAMKGSPDPVTRGMLVDNGMLAAVVGAAMQARIGQTASGQKFNMTLDENVLKTLVSTLDRNNIKPNTDYQQTLRDARQNGSKGVTGSQVGPKANGATAANGKDGTQAANAKKTGKAAEAPAPDREFDPSRISKELVTEVLGKGHPKAAEVEKEMTAILKGVGTSDGLAVTGALLEAFEKKFGFQHPLALYVNQLKDAQVSDELKVQIGQFGRDRVGGDFVRCSVDPAAAQALQAGAAQQAAMYGQMFAGLGGMGPGMGGLNPGGVHGNMGLPGDAGNIDAAARKQSRAAVGMMILNDPSLSVEDKVMMFVLWMTVFADEDILDKARELAEFERKDEMKQAHLRQANIKVGDTSKLRSDAERAYKLEQGRSGTVLNNPAATPEQKQEAEKKLGESKKAFETARGYEVQAQQVVAQLETPSEGPLKSREMISMEMRQMENRRNQLMDFCRSFLEGRNRNMEKIWR